MAQAIEVRSEHTLLRLLAQEARGFPLELATPAQLTEWARAVSREDAFHYATAVRASAGLLPGVFDSEDFVPAHLEHLFWVEHRKALWRSGRIRSEQSVGCRLLVEGKENLEATAGYPTVVITPMMLAYEDALWMTHALSGSREVALYGEDLFEDGTLAELAKILGLKNVRLVGEAPGSLREVLRTLRQGGLFLTYPDFVYRGHKVHHAPLFGMKWPFSSSFIALCASPGNMLLPCHLRREANDLTIQFAEPIHVAASEDREVDRRWVMHLVGATVARLLESMILSNPAQWLLLLTLVARPEQRAE